MKDNIYLWVVASPLVWDKSHRIFFGFKIPTYRILKRNLQTGEVRFLPSWRQEVEACQRSNGYRSTRPHLGMGLPS